MKKFVFVFVLSLVIVSASAIFEPRARTNALLVASRQEARAAYDQLLGNSRIMFDTFELRVRMNSVANNVALAAQLHDFRAQAEDCLAQLRGNPDGIGFARAVHTIVTTAQRHQDRLRRYILFQQNPAQYSNPFVPVVPHLDFH